jgi:putative membrane protein insertion efficiency factor
MDPVRRRRLKVWLSLLAILLLLGLDMARPPRDQVSARVLLGGIHLYQATLSPRLGALGVRCRFQPTCSHYGEGAIRKYGAWKGTWKTLWRIARCGPWTPAGTVDLP